MSRERASSQTDLIEALTSDLEAVRPVRSARLFLGCLLVQALVIGGFLALVGGRADLGERLADPMFSSVVALLAGAAAWCGALAIRSAIPGRAVARGASRLLPALPLALAGLVLVFNPSATAWPGLAELASGCLRCAGLTAAAAAIPWFVTLAVVSRLAPLNELRVGMFAGMSAFLLGAVVTELHCGSDSSYHLAFGHYAPVVLLAAATSVVAAAVMRRRFESR